MAVRYDPASIGGLMRSVYLLFAASLVLAGCIGMTQREIRAQAVEVRQTSVPASRVLECFKVELNDLARTVTYPHDSKVEVSIGAEQAGDYRLYYLVGIQPEGEATVLSIRRTARAFVPLPPQKFGALLDRCAPAM
ncbi:hypothetical protein BL241_08300 [Ralstonia solanacearum]|uniref:Uncharacterized protein n=1 Tax=Ralstonia solanacearum TaxID=305 RepID=A0A0S4U3Y3_RALSL|nr:hypothetical protein BL241_08300 [Ralstonia solanacearum]BCL86711.1 hypothetical protein MAFF211471_17940 [Ralstonia solanacearum]BCM99260.1 hypothetical protein RPSA_17970 [Ralstonia solanacearum]CUV16941.1 protein of unknown function [Ralstonia solanacearum]